MRRIMVTTCDMVDWMRNNSGVAHHKDGSYVRYGLGGIKGPPDLVGIRRRDGRFIACEVKGPNGRPTAEQLKFLLRVENAGGIAVLAYSVRDVIEAIS